MRYSPTWARLGTTILLVTSCLMLSLPRVTAQDSTSSTSINSLSWSPDGQMLAVAGLIEGRLAIHLYDNDGNLLQQRAAEGTVPSITWSPDSSRLAFLVIGNPDTINIWEINSTQIGVTIPQEGGTSTYEIGWSPDGTLLSSVRSHLNIWDAATGRRVASLQSNSSRAEDVQAFAWYLRGDQIASIGADRVLYVWDVTTSRINQQAQLTAFIVSMAMSPDGTQLALGSSDGSVQVVDANDVGTLITAFQGPTDALWHLDWAPQGDQIAVAGSRSDITIWDLSSAENIDSIVKATYGFLEAMEYSTYGGRLAYSTKPGSIGAPPVQKDVLGRRSYSESVLGGAVQFVVPTPSLERLQTIGQHCNAPENIMGVLNTTERLPEFVIQVRSLTDAQIPSGCAADLIAVAEALQ